MVFRKNKQDIDAVFFDMDGLIFDSERFICECWVAAGRELGIPLTPEIFSLCIGHHEEESRSILTKALGQKWDYPAFRALADDKLAQSLPPLKPGFASLYGKLKQNGILTAVVTSTAKHKALPLLQSQDLDKSMDALVFCSEAPLRPKPHPDGYLKALNSLSCRSERCIVLEDSPTGVRSAIAASCPVIMIPDLLAPDGFCIRYCLDIYFGLELLEKNLLF